MYADLTNTSHITQQMVVRNKLNDKRKFLIRWANCIVLGCICLSEISTYLIHHRCCGHIRVYSIPVHASPNCYVIYHFVNLKSRPTYC